jgi:two-component system sensor histidine kinase DesK
MAQATQQSEGYDGTRRGWRKAMSLFWLIYLGFYFFPWFWKRPGQTELIVSISATALFLAIYFDAYLRWPARRLPHMLAMAAIGFGLSLIVPTNPTWGVFIVYAAVLASLLDDRRAALLSLTLLLVAVAAYGVVRQMPIWAWTPTIFLAAMTGFGTLWQADVSRKNAQLVRAQEEVRTLAATAERERIARDLHDLLGHTLTLVAVKADLAQQLASRDPAAARREMQDVAETARGALAEVRAAVAGMRGATLAAEIERARRMLAAANVEASVTTEAAPDDPAREAVLAMALREAVTNVIRHAGASACAIGLEAEPEGALRLTVVDDGRGGEIREGSGLAGMRARLSAAGGVLEVSSDARGTRLMARLPKAAA